MASLPLVCQLENRDSTPGGDAYMSNCFAEPLDGGRFMAVKRAGLVPAFDGMAGCGQGLYNFLEALYSISGDYLNVNKTIAPGFSLVTSSAPWNSRTGMQAIGFLGQLWVMGGSDAANNYYHDVYRSTDGFNWVQVTAAAPWPDRAFGSVIVFAGKMWIMGGFGSFGIGLSDVWSTVDGVTWTQANASAWPGRAELGLTTFNNKMWVAGGQSQKNGSYYFADVWSSVDGVTWVNTSPHAPWLPRSRLGFAGFNGQLVVLAGEFEPTWQGAGGDLWTSTDGVAWTRFSSNPFAQAATGAFPRAVLTSQGAAYQAPPSVTITPGPSTAFSFLDDDGDDDTENDPGLAMVTITTGSGYSSAPAISFTLGGGIGAVGYTMLKANGVAGDKRGMIVSTSSTLYFFAFLNNGLPSNEIWQSTDGTTWTLALASAQYGGRDSVAFSLGDLWVISGTDSTNTYYHDVWAGSFTPTTQIALTNTTPCLSYSFSQTSSTVTFPLLFFKSIKDAYTYNPATNLITKVTDVDYPSTTVPGIVYLDGYFFVMDPQGRVWNSALNDPQTWNALGVITAQAEPNGGVALAKLGNYVVAFGVWSTVFFYDAAVPAPASPLLPNTTLDAIIGCASGDSVVEMQDNVVWIGQSIGESRGVYSFQGQKPIRISTPFVDRIIKADQLANVRAFKTEVNGHFFYVLTLVNSNTTLAYDFNLKHWAVWSSRTQAQTVTVNSLSSDPYGSVTANAPGHGYSDGDPVFISGAVVNGYNGLVNVIPIDTDNFTYRVPAALTTNSGTAAALGSSEGYFVGVKAATLAGIDYILHENSGEIFQYTSESFSDNGAPIDVKIITPNWNGGTTAYKTFLNLTLVADVIQGTAVLRYTDNDYGKYSNYRQLDLSSNRPYLSQLGNSRRRAFQLRYTGTTPFRVEKLEFELEEGNF